MAEASAALRSAQGLELLAAGLEGFTETSCRLLLSCEDLLRLAASEDLGAALSCQPAEALQCLACAAHEARLSSCPLRQTGPADAAALRRQVCRC